MIIDPHGENMKKNTLIMIILLLVLLPAISANSDTGKIIIKKFIFNGNSIFSDIELSEISSSYENRELSLAELEDLRYRLSMFYIDKGFINSGVMIPDQKMPDDYGNITLKIVEGSLDKIEISGNERLKKGYIEDRIRLGAEPPLNMKKLQERLQIIQTDPLIETINADLKPGIVPGKADLDVKIHEARAYHGGLQYSNSYSPGAGSQILETFASHENLTGNGDSLELKYGFTESLYDYSGSYSIPVNSRDTRIRLSYSRNSSTLIEEPFDELDIESKSENYEISVTHPVFKTIDSEVKIGLITKKEYSETYLLNKPFSFSEGVINGKSDVSVIRFSQDFVSKSGYQVVAARSLLSLGINAFGSTDNAMAPDSQFFSWIGQIQWARQMEKLLNSQMIIRTDIQLAADALLPIEQFAIGGGKSVRGYRENQLVRDNGIVSSIEFRIPLINLKIPGVSSHTEDGRLSIAPFFDYGAGWNTRRKSPGALNISSAGLGLRYDPSQYAHAHIYWGYPFRDIDTSDDDLQDDGIHFLASCWF